MTRKAIFVSDDAVIATSMQAHVSGISSALGLLCQKGFQIIVLGMEKPGVMDFFLRLRTEVRIAAIYRCPHAEGQSCGCRSPEPGFLFQAQNDHWIDLRRSWMIGDTLDDVEAGHRAGCRSILLENGRETEWRFSYLRFPFYMALDLESAAREIVRTDGIASGRKAFPPLRNPGNALPPPDLMINRSE